MTPKKHSIKFENGRRYRWSPKPNDIIWDWVEFSEEQERDEKLDRDAEFLYHAKHYGSAGYCMGDWYVSQGDCGYKTLNPSSYFLDERMF